MNTDYVDKIQVSLVQETDNEEDKSKKHGKNSKNAKKGCKCVSCCMPSVPSFPNFDFVFPLIKISMVMPDILSQFNILPKEFEHFFTDDMFDQIMQESICKKMYQVMIGDTEFMAYLETYVKNYPKGLQFQEQYLVPSKTSATFLERNTKKGNNKYLAVLKKSINNVKKVYKVNEQPNAPPGNPSESVETEGSEMLNELASGPLEAVTSGIESLTHSFENNFGIPDKIVDNIQEVITSLETEAKQILTEYISSI